MLSIKKFLIGSLLGFTAASSSWAAYTPWTYSLETVDFTILQTDINKFTLTIDGLPDANGSWANVTHVSGLSFKGIGDFSSASITADPAGATVWSYYQYELNANGCNLAGNADPMKLCFAGSPPLAITDLMKFYITTTEALDFTLPHLKVNFGLYYDPNGPKDYGYYQVGDLLSKNFIPATCTGNCGGGGDEIPEPGSLALVAVGLLGAGLVSRRRQSKKA